MPTTLEEHAVEGSTFVIHAELIDEAGEAATPNELSWTLTDTAGRIINDREDEALTPGATMDILLHGDDLLIGRNGNKRIITLNGTYDSDLGSGLELRDQIIFYIDDLATIS